MSLQNKTKIRTLRCEDCAEVVAFKQYSWDDGETSYEINLEDAYCDSGYCGIRGRFRRAWKAFWAKPVYYSGIYIENGARVRQFLQDCLALVEENTHDDQGN